MLNYKKKQYEACFKYMFFDCQVRVERRNNTRIVNIPLHQISLNYFQIALKQQTQLIHKRAPQNLLASRRLILKCCVCQETLTTVCAPIPLRCNQRHIGNVVQGKSENDLTLPNSHNSNFKAPCRWITRRCS